MMTDLLREPKPTIALNEPPSDIRLAARAFEAGAANSDQQRRLWRFILHELAGVSQLVLAMPAEESVANWRAGARYVGLYLDTARVLPVDDPPPAEPPARTFTERAKRRATTQG